jgi:uncharacterized protein YabN with tetrapyrrole methylase and pyrophosphatase domain
LKEYKDFVEHMMNAELKIPREDYLKRKLLSELGELLGELTKSEAHGKPLNKEDIIAELGDILFYAVALNWYSNVRVKTNLTKTSDAIYELFTYYYIIAVNIPNNKALILNPVFQTACKEFNLTIEQIMGYNIQKLKKRHGDKFDPNFYLNC